jgi:uncharacterized protein YegP (UPF0339 family)
MWHQACSKELHQLSAAEGAPENPMNTARIFRSSLLALALVSLASVSGCAYETAPVDGSSSALSARPYFNVFRGADDDYYFNLRAANHEIILASEGYSSRSSALNGVLSVMDNGELRTRYELREAVNGEPYFVLKARNGRVIGRSETYSTRYSADRGIVAVMRNVGDYLDFLANRTGARFDIFRGVDGRHYFNLHAANGEIVLSSQGYSAESSALNGTFSVADNGVDASRYDVRESADGGYYFNLKARNGRVIGTSEVYVSRSNAERAVQSIIALLPEVELL